MSRCYEWQAVHRVKIIFEGDPTDEIKVLLALERRLTALNLDHVCGEIRSVRIRRLERA